MRFKILGLIKLTNWLFGATTKGEEMSKEDVVAAGVAKIGELMSQAYPEGVGVGYDGGFAEGVASVPAGPGGGFTQEQLDAQVQAAKDADALVLAGALAADQKAFDDAKAASDTAMADMQSKLDALTVKEGQEASVIAGLQGAKDQLAAVLASLLAIGNPAPEPVPVDPAPPVEPDPQP